MMAKQLALTGQLSTQAVTEYDELISLFPFLSVFLNLTNPKSP